MVIAAPPFRLIARLALLAMLCQSLLPTAAYTSAAQDPAMLSKMAQAFGVPDRVTATSVHAHHHHSADASAPASASASEPAAPPGHDHGVHCALCLAHVLDLTLVLFAVPAALKLPFDRPRYTVFHAIFFTSPLRAIMPRGPPLSTADLSYR